MPLERDPRLPIGMSRDNTCCFTGHRRLPADPTALADDLAHTVRFLADRGIRYFLCGGALGFDTLAAEIVLARIDDGADIHLVLALPCRNQTEKWTAPTEEALTASLRTYSRIKGRADAVVYVEEFYSPTCMKARNQYMVDHSAVCVAYYNGSPRSGSGQTFRMAQKSGLEICNLHDGALYRGTTRLADD